MSSLWQKYTSLSSNTRVVLGLGMMGYAAFALYASDSAEKSFGLEASEEDRRILWSWLPKIQAVEPADKEKSYKIAKNHNDADQS